MPSPATCRRARGSRNRPGAPQHERCRPIRSQAPMRRSSAAVRNQTRGEPPVTFAAQRSRTPIMFRSDPVQDPESNRPDSSIGTGMPAQRQSTRLRVGGPIRPWERRTDLAGVPRGGVGGTCCDWSGAPARPGRVGACREAGAVNPAADAARHRGRAGEGQDGAGDEADREPRGAVVLDRLGGDRREGLRVQRPRRQSGHRPDRRGKVGRVGRPPVLACHGRGTCWSGAATSVPRAFGGAEDTASWASGERRSTGLAAAAGIAIGPDEESTRRGAARARVERQALTKPCGSRTNFFDAPLSKSL
jgi:hypothetical protein